MIGSNEVAFDPSQPKEFLGTPYPTTSAGITSSISVAHLRLWAQLDYQGGHHKFDNAARLRCNRWPVCAPLSVMSSALTDKEQAALAYLYPSYRHGFIEDASFLKWRELAVEWQLPTPWVHWFHASSMMLSAAVRNVATWTGYKGLDPEATASQDNFRQVDFYTQPQVRYFVARLTAGF
jgi:hypothetical protein